MSKSSVTFRTPIAHFEAATVNLEIDSLISVYVGRNNIGKSRLVEAINAKFKQLFSIASGDREAIELLVNYHPDERIRDFSNRHHRQREFFDRQGDPNEAAFQKLVSYPLNGGGQIDQALIDEFCDWFFHSQTWHPEIKMAAERDIRSGKIVQMTPSPNGDDFLSLTYYHISQPGGEPDVVNKTIRQGMNKILSPDYQISFIHNRETSSQVEGQQPNRTIEFDFTDGRRLLDIGSLGSGIKTIYQALMMIHGYQVRLGTPPRHFIFEEIENNLHPRAIRRLIDYIIENTKEPKSRLTFTTHSPIVLDHLARKHEAAVHHVVSVNGRVACYPIRNYAAMNNAVDDLGAKASDLLQANFVVWVEGPTELLVIPHWISKIDPSLSYGSDFVVAIYGGRLLSHFSADEPSNKEDKRIEVARINRNYAFVMDSDAAIDEKPLTPGKQAIVDAREKGIEFEIWVTNGREIEDYYPNEVFVAMFGEPLQPDVFNGREKNWGFKQTLFLGWTKSDQDSKKLPLAKKLIELDLEPSDEVKAGLAPIIEAIQKANE